DGDPWNAGMLGNGAGDRLSLICQQGLDAVTLETARQLHEECSVHSHDFGEREPDGRKPFHFRQTSAKDGDPEKPHVVPPTLQLATERAHRVDVTWEGWGDQREPVDL